jgi:predicted heme/steroid binding protein
MRLFTREELKKYDGSQGIAYVAYQGKVYDVSLSYQWKRGLHQLTHYAGRDLTRDSKKAPHTPDLLFRFPVIGQLAEAENES